MNYVKTIPFFQSIPIHTFTTISIQSTTTSNNKLRYQQLCDSNLSIDLDSVNDVISRYSASYQVDYGFSMLGLLFKLGVPPNQSTFHSLLTGLVSVNKHLDADILFHKLIRLKQIQPDMATYRSLIRGVLYSESNQSNVAAQDLNSFSRSVGLITYVKLFIGYDALIAEYCQLHQHTPTALHLFEEMISIPLTPSDNTYNAILQILFYRGYYLDAASLFLKMKDEGVPIYSFTYAVIIDSFCKDKLFNDALCFLSQMELDLCFSGIHLYNTVINHLFSAGEVDKAIIVFDKLSDLCYIQPNAATYAEMLLGFTNQGLWDDALDLLPEIESNDKLPHEFKLACHNYFNDSQTIQPDSAYPAHTSTISIFRDLPPMKQVEQL